MPINAIVTTSEASFVAVLRATAAVMLKMAIHPRKPINGQSQDATRL